MVMVDDDDYDDADFSMLISLSYEREEDLSIDFLSMKSAES